MMQVCLFATSPEKEQLLIPALIYFAFLVQFLILHQVDVVK